MKNENKIYAKIQKNATHNAREPKDIIRHVNEIMNFERDY